jgi:hypothetical protein
MDGVVKAAVHMGDWKFTTLFREVGSAMMLKKISSPFAWNVIAGFIQSDKIESARNWVTPDPSRDFIVALVSQSDHAHLLAKQIGQKSKCLFWCRLRVFGHLLIRAVIPS